MRDPASVWIQLILRLRLVISRFLFLFFFFPAHVLALRNKVTVYTLFPYCSQDPQLFYLEKMLKMSLTILFIHLKIIFQ